MDLFNYITRLEKQGNIHQFAIGFSKSEFNPITDNVSGLVRAVFESNIKLKCPNQRSSKPTQLIYQQLQSGAIAAGANGVVSEKSPSFCSEFDQMITNISGLISYEFGYFIMLIMGTKTYLRNLARKIEFVTSWDELYNIVRSISNGFAIGDDYGTFSIPVKFQIDRSFISFNEDTTQCERKPKFDSILADIQRGITAQNIMALEGKKMEIMKTVLNVIDEIQVGKYLVNSVDQLVINDINPPNYIGSFIKMWEILYKESFADYPPEYIRTSRIKPYMKYSEKISVAQKISLCGADLNGHFRTIFSKIVDEMRSESIYSDELVDVFVSDDAYQQLTDIALNLFVTLGVSMVEYQTLYTRFGKSTRTQFMQIILSIGLGCIPRYYDMTHKQLNMLHYVLLEQKSIAKSIDIVRSSRDPLGVVRQFNKNKE